MRPSNKSRSRNKPGGSHNNQRRGGGGGNMGNVANRVFESAGPDGKVRGTPQQIIDKYQALARDAQLSGDRVIAENYLQHSEHYSRLLGEATRHINEQRAAQQERESSQPQRSDQQGGDDDQGGRESWQNRDRQADEDRNDGRNDGRNGREDRQNRDQGHDGRQNGRDDRQNRDRGRDDRHAADDQTRDDQTRDDHGLTTIDPTDDRVESGPVETPEGRRRNPRVTRPAEREDAGPSEGEATTVDEAAAGEADRQPAKRPRTRRKAKTDTDPATAAARAD